MASRSLSLNAQLGGAPHLGAPVGEQCQHREERNLVDELRHFLGAHRGAVQPGGADHDRTHGLPERELSSVMSADAPMRRTASRKPHRVGLMPQPLIVSVLP